MKINKSNLNKTMSPGTKIYSKEIKNMVGNFSGTILEDLGDQFLIEIGGCKVYINKDRVTENLKELLDIT